MKDSKTAAIESACGRPLVERRWLLFVFGAAFSLLAASSSLWTAGKSSAWLAEDRAYAVPVSSGRGQVDVYLTADRPVTMLLSNLGPSNHASTVRLTATRLQTAPRFRPQALVSSDLKYKNSVSPRPWYSGGQGDSVKRRSASAATLIDAKSNSTQTLSKSASPATRDFWVHVTSRPLEDSHSYQQVHGRLAACNDSVHVYIDISLQNAGQIPASLTALATEIANQLQREVLPVTRRLIGPVTDVDRDGRLTVVMTPWLGRLRSGETSVKGFVRSSDFRGEVAVPFGNHSDILYLNSDLPAQSGLHTLLLHEITHAALFSTPQMQRPSHEFEWDDWLNEGLAHLTERSGGGDWSNLDYRVARYWQDPAAAPLLVSDYYRCGRWRDHGCRGATYLFLKWCEQEYSRSGRDDFMAELLATRKPGISGITQVMGHKFEDLYRDWTISQARAPGNRETQSRVGSFGNSGPRAVELRVDERSESNWMICGTATQFVTVYAPQSGWYRVSLASDPQQPWQFTMLLNPPKPKVDLKATWNPSSGGESPELLITGWESLPSAWHVDSVYAEQTQEPRSRSWRWSASELEWLPSHQRFLKLHLSPDGASASVIKVRLKRDDGQSAWTWCDVPPREGVRMTSRPVSASGT